MSHERHSDPLDRKPDPAKSAQACRRLIRAFLDDPDQLRDALDAAVAAFGLPENFIETEGGRWN